VYPFLDRPVPHIKKFHRAHSARPSPRHARPPPPRHSQRRHRRRPHPAPASSQNSSLRPGLPHRGRPSCSSVLSVRPPGAPRPLSRSLAPARSLSSPFDRRSKLLPASAPASSAPKFQFGLRERRGRRKASHEIGWGRRKSCR
jgi:hypothetical protein